MKPCSLYAHIFRAACFGGAWFAAAHGLSAESPTKPTPPADTYNLAFFPYMFGGASENDARAAFKYWVQVIGEESGVAVTSTSRIFNRNTEVLAAAQAGAVDIVAFCSVDYLAIRDQLPPGAILSPIRPAGQTERYVLVAQVDAPGNHLSDFAGKSLFRLSLSSALLAPLWLEGELHAADLPTSAHFFSEIRSLPKPAKVLLPVFFKQADLCLTTRQSFETLCELNPQVKSKLRIIAESPPVVSSLIWVALPPQSAVHLRALNAIRHLEKTTTGKQTLMMFQFERMQDCPDELLDTTRELLRRLPASFSNPADLLITNP